MLRSPKKTLGLENQHQLDCTSRGRAGIDNKMTQNLRNPKPDTGYKQDLRVIGGGLELFLEAGGLFHSPLPSSQHRALLDAQKDGVPTVRA